MKFKDECPIVDETSETQAPRKRRNWRGLSLRALLFIVTIVAVAFGLVGRKLQIQRNQSRAIKKLTQLGQPAQFGYRDPYAESKYQWLRGKFTHAVTFDMRWNRAEPEEYAPAISDLPYLTRLYLGECRVTDDAVKSITACRDLQRLELKDNSAITDASTNHLLRLKKLDALNVRGTNMTWKSFVRLATLPELNEFSFDHEFSQSQLAEFAEAGRFCCRSLSVRGIQAANLPLLAKLKSEAPKNKTLIISRSQVTKEWEQPFRQIDCGRVEFRECRFAPGLFDTYQLKCGSRGRIAIHASADAFAEAVGSLTHAGSILIRDHVWGSEDVDADVYLAITSPNGQSQHVEFFVPASAITALKVVNAEVISAHTPRVFSLLKPELIHSAKRLELEEMQSIRSETDVSFIPRIEEITQGSPAGNLRRLKLSSDSLTDEQLMALTELPNLEVLQLSSKKLNGSGLQALSSLQHLHEIRLEYTPSITWNGTQGIVENLRPLTQLKTLYLPVWRPTPNRPAEIRKQLPYLEVIAR